MTNSDRSAMDVPRVVRRSRPRNIALGIGGGAFVLTSAALALRPAPETRVVRSSLVIDSVRRGVMVREVVGTGFLVPDRVRIVAAATAGRVEQLPVSPGTSVTPSTVIVEISNPEVQLERLESERNLNSTQAALVEQEGAAHSQALTLEGALATLSAEAANARRQLDVFESLDSIRMVPKTELAAARDRSRELNTREALERERLRLHASTARRQLVLQKRQVDRLEAISRFHSGRVASMRVFAGQPGVLQELPLTLGQWVNPGMLLARIAEPGRLKAVIRVPEAQAGDIAIGQSVSIDTRNGIVAGRVVRVAPASQGGTVEVEATLDGEMPKGSRAEQAVDATIEVEKLANILYTARPANAQPGRTVELYRLAPDGKSAERVRVQVGAVSVNTVEIRRGLNQGDRVIVSDIGVDEAERRVRIR
jgi:HlyD family secretion protein